MTHHERGQWLIKLSQYSKRGILKGGAVQVIMISMRSGRRLTLFECEAGKLSVRIVSDPAGRVETPALPNPRVAIHMGRSAHVSCQCGANRYTGAAVHGDVYVIPADTPCIWERDVADTCLIIGIERDSIAAAAAELGDSTQPNVLSRFEIRDPQIEHICWAIKATVDSVHQTGPILVDGLAKALATAVVSRHSSLATTWPCAIKGMSGYRLRAALSYIETNLNRSLTLSELAKAAGVSASHFKSAFREAMGIPVHQYVIQRRVERARELLSTATSSISSVAAETGFAHQSHLARHMRRILGCSPKQIRYLPGAKNGLSAVP